MKVVLDFQNLGGRIDDPNIVKHLDAMAEMAKEAKGFLFYVDKGDTAGMQVCGLNSISLFSMIDTLEEDHPELAQMKGMFDLFKGRKRR